MIRFSATGAGVRLRPRAGAAAGGSARRKRPRVAALAAGATLAVVAGTLAGAGSASGAQATITNLAYHCAFPSGAQPVSVSVAATFPESGAAGQAIQPAEVRLTIVVPPAALMNLASPVTPVAGLSVKLAQGGTSSTTRWAGLTAPQTAVPLKGALTVVATGAVPAATPSGAGDITFGADALDIAFSSATTVSCSLDAGQTGTLATVPVSTVTTSGPPATTRPPAGSQASGAAVQPNAAIQLQGWVIVRANVNKLGEAVTIGPAPLNITNTGSAIVNGDFHLYWSGTIVFPPTKATFLDFGFTPSVGTMNFTEVGKLWIDSWAHAGVPHATAVDNEEIRVHDLTANGTVLDAGQTCQTKTPVHITLVGVNGYQPVLGGPLEGTVDIPPFAGCGVTENLNPLFTGSISGPGNLTRGIQGKPCNVNVPTCKPTVPVFY